MRITIIFLVALLAGCSGAESDVKQSGRAESPLSAVDGPQVNQNDAGEHNREADQHSGLSNNSPATRERATDASAFSHELKILHWNIESGGNDPQVIAEQLVGFVNEGYQVLALSEVDKADLYQRRLESLHDNPRWRSVLGESGTNRGRDSDRLMILYDSSRLKLMESRELNRFGEFDLNTGRHRSPLVATFECLKSGQPFLLVLNHLARGDAEFRAEQASGLREFARGQSIAQIAVGDYNFDFEFETRQGNEGLVQMLKDNIWKWVEPAELIDSNWYDPEGDGVDNFPGSILDFTFVAGAARDWEISSSVIVRDGDFPDDEKTSDHRPLNVIVQIPAG